MSINFREWEIDQCGSDLVGLEEDNRRLGVKIIPNLLFPGPAPPATNASDIVCFVAGPALISK